MKLRAQLSYLVLANIVQFLKDYITSFTQVQSRALSCLSNILIGFPPKGRDLTDFTLALTYSPLLTPFLNTHDRI